MILVTNYTVRGDSFGADKPRVWLAFAFGVLGVLIVGQSSVLGLLRIANTDAAADHRSSFATTTWNAALQYFPTGSGFGSFVPIYQTREMPETLVPEYVNHAHNDWLELLLEGGLPAVVLLGLFLVWLGIGGLRAWRGNLFAQRTGFVVVALLIAHSVVDYPLRTPALMVFFAIFCGLIALPVQTSNRMLKKKRIVPVSQATEDVGPRPFRRPEQGFGPREIKRQSVVH